MTKRAVIQRQRNYSKRYYNENKEAILLDRKISYARKTKGQLGVYEVLENIKRDTAVEVINMLSETSYGKWTPEELKIVTDTRYTAQEVAKLTGRTIHAVKCRRSVLLHDNNPAYIIA
jgi:hypothetical protein